MSGGIYTTDKSKTLQSLADVAMDSIQNNQAPVYDSTQELFINQTILTTSDLLNPLFQVFGTNTTVATGSSGTYKLDNWDTPIIDEESGSFGWDSTNSEYRCPLDGNYRVSMSVQFQAVNLNNRALGAYIYKNNTLFSHTLTTFVDVTGSPEYQYVSITNIIPCSQGDTIDIRSDAISNLNIFYRNSHFNVEFIQ